MIIRVHGVFVNLSTVDEGSLVGQALFRLRANSFQQDPNELSQGVSNAISITK